MKKSLAITIFCLLCALVLGVGAYAWSLDSELEGAGRESGARGSAAVGEFASALAGLSEASREALCSNDAAMQSSLTAKAAANAASAVTALAAMPCSTQELETLALYLNGAGDYALALSRGCARGEKLGEAEREGLAALAGAVGRISSEAGGILSALEDGELCLDEYGASLEGAEGTVGAALAELDAALDDFPELEYSGRYSSRDTSAALLTSFTPVDSETARRKAAEFLGVERSALSPAGKSAAEVPCFAFDFEGGRVNVTETGGVVLSMSSALAGGVARITAEEAQNTAESFVNSRYDCDFTVVSAAERAGAYDFVLAPLSAEGALLLPDSVTVTVDAAGGEIAAVNAADYVMNHAERGALTPGLTAEAAAAALHPSLSVDSARLVLAETEGGEEALCWEYACLDGGVGRVYVYIDASSGDERKIELSYT